VPSSEARQPIAQVLSGLEIHPLEAGWTPIEALVVVKCLNENGEPTWSYRTTNKLNREELLGVLTIHADLIRRELLAEWEEDDES
jgi:hypothetical protein